MSEHTQGDPLLVIGPDGGEIMYALGVVTMTQAFETAAALSYFGGNYEDNGSPNNRQTWWANYDETIPERKYVSRVQNLIASLPANAANRALLQQAAELDVAWFLETRAASEITVLVVLTGADRVEIRTRIVAQGVEIEFNFTVNWKAA